MFIHKNLFIFMSNLGYNVYITYLHYFTYIYINNIFYLAEMSMHVLQYINNISSGTSFTSSP